MLKESLLRAIVGCTGETRQVYQQRNLMDLVVRCLWGQVEVEGHFTICGLSIVCELEQLSAKTGDGGFRRNRHGARNESSVLLLDEREAW